MLTKLFIAAFLVNQCLSGPLSKLEIAKPRADSTNYRLPDTIQPLNYEVKLAPNFVYDSFTGSVKIEIKVLKTTNEIILHTKELTILENIVLTEKTTPKTIDVVSAGKHLTDEHEFYKITLKENLGEGKSYILDIPNFRGILNNDKSGFYLAKYTDAAGNPKKFATTQFEPTGARRTFPCFDEPALKAKFKITLVRPNENFITVANTPMIAKKAENTAVEDEFEETEEMSTYLLAFIVTEMRLSEKRDRHRILAKQEDITAGKHTYALATGDSILKKIEEFLGVPYTFKKMDQAAIPDEYFSAGAMENWGLVTYRETYLLHSPDTTTTSRHQNIATIIAHEFGHQWFGNLVSPSWWKHIWLNEGFATYFENLAASMVEPTWEIMEQYVIKTVQYAFYPDSLESTRIMNADAGTPREISALFDRVAYEKSGSVIRMLEMAITTDVFKKGLQYYLTEMGHKAAVPEDLYRNLQKAVAEKTNVLPNGLTVSSIMTSWDSVKGYPVVHITRNYDTAPTVVKLEQTRFLLKNTAIQDGSWKIPINFAKKSDPNFDVTVPDEWFMEKTKDVTISNLAATDWLIANKKQTGYYRVNYDEKNWDLISTALQEDHTKINVLNRAQLLDDSFNLARAQRLPYRVPMKLASYLNKEREYIAFYPFINALPFLQNMLANEEAYANFKTYVLSSLDGIYKHLGFDEKSGDKHTEKLNRVNVLKWVCDMGHSECRNKSLEKLRDWKDKSVIPALNLRSPIFCGAMRQGSQDDFDFLYKKYNDPTTNSEARSWILNGLGCSENEEILKKFIDNSLQKDSPIKPANAISSVYKGGPIGLKVAFDYLINNFETLKTHMSENNMKDLLTGIGDRLTNKADIDKLKTLAAQNRNQASIFITAIDNTDFNTLWLQNNLDGINEWFSISKGGSKSNMYTSVFVVVISYVLCRIVA